MPRFILSARLHELKEKFQPKSIFDVKLSTKGWVIVFCLLIIVSGIIYLGQINSLATKGYAIMDLQNQEGNLKDQNKQLEIQISQLRSTARINEEISKLDMVKVAKIEYLKDNGTAVAVNR